MIEELVSTFGWKLEYKNIELKNIKTLKEKN